MRVSPRDPKLYQMRGLVALAALHMQRPREALSWAESAVAANPDYAAGYSYVAAAAAQLGDRPRAEAALAEFRRLLPGRSIQALRDERWSDRPGYLAGQEHFLDGLRMAGLPDR
jgi:adenylate cyclase